MTTTQLIATTLIFVGTAIVTNAGPGAAYWQQRHQAIFASKHTHRGIAQGETKAGNPTTAPSGNCPGCASCRMNG